MTCKKNETCAKCKKKPTYRIEGYAEQGWEGGFVFVYLCDEHYQKLADYLDDEENEPWDNIHDLVGVEFITEIDEI